MNLAWGFRPARAGRTAPGSAPNRASMRKSARKAGETTRESRGKTVTEPPFESLDLAPLGRTAVLRLPGKQQLQVGVVERDGASSVRVDVFDKLEAAPLEEQVCDHLVHEIVPVHDLQVPPSGG